MNKIKIQDVLIHLKKQKIEYEFVGNPAVVLNYVCATFDLKNNGLSFYNSDAVDSITNVVNYNNLIILKENVKTPILKGNIIYTENPSLCFNIVAWLFKPKRVTIIHKSVIIGENVVLGQNVSIGAYTIIGNGVTIGNNVDISENCVIRNSNIGNDVKIQPGVKIGSMGLGSYQKENGEWVDFPHFGLVIIEDGVVIQDNTVINRGTLNDTIIRKFSRIGPLCWIAHGVIINRFFFIIFLN